MEGKEFGGVIDAFAQARLVDLADPPVNLAPSLEGQPLIGHLSEERVLEAARPIQVHLEERAQPIPGRGIPRTPAVAVERQAHDVLLEARSENRGIAQYRAV